MRNPPGGPAAPALVVVDAANVVGSRPDRWWRDRAVLILSRTGIPAVAPRLGG
ncbi:MAG: hypothetical protein M3165_04330 [Actinomycetota bacterium]|nr:hypothetical protein [Actinomycetota bacterium]